MLSKEGELWDMCREFQSSSYSTFAIVVLYTISRPRKTCFVEIQLCYIPGLATVAPLIQLLTMPFCPESPRYLLINQGKEDEALKGKQIICIFWNNVFIINFNPSMDN